MTNIVPLFGTGNGVKSKYVSAQRRLNCYVEQIQDPDKSALPIYTRSGLQKFNYSIIQFLFTANLLVQGPIRGMQYTQQTQIVTGNVYGNVPFLWTVVGNSLVKMSASGFAVTFGDGSGVLNGLMLTSSGTVQMSDNGQQIIWVDGAGGYVYNYQTLAGGRITNAAFPNGATSVTFLAGAFICNDPLNPGRFWWSSLYDGTTWNGLNFATAESNPDPLNCVFESGGTLLLIGTNTTEFWAPQTSGALFQRVGGSGIDWGSTAPATVKKYQGGVVMLGRNLGGERQVVMIEGYRAQVISNPDVEAAINAVPGTDGITACVSTIQGHAFYILNLPNTSYAFNGQTGTWDEWGTADSRWCGQFVTQGFGSSQFVSDYRDETLYTIADNYFYDGTTPIKREIITKHAFNNYDRMSINELTVDCEVGDLTVPGVTATALDIPGSNAINVGDQSYWTFSNGTNDLPFSVECWVRPRVVGGPVQGLLVKGETGGSIEWNVQIDAGGVARFLMADTTLGGIYRCIGPTVLPVNAWTHIAATYDGSGLITGMKLYINGILENITYTPTGTYVTMRNSTSPLTLGAFNNSGTPSAFLTGTLGEMRVWNYQRTAAQISTDMMTALPPSTTGLVGLFSQFNPGTAGTVYGNNTPIAITYLATQASTNPNVYVTAPRAPQMMLQTSRDNGNTWGNELWQSMGQLGQYKQRLRWNRVGRARDFVFRFRVADPVNVVITGGAISVK